MAPRSIYVPWRYMAIGNYEWTGTPLRPMLDAAGLLDDAVEVLFTGWDEGIDLGVEHAFERSLPVEEALRDVARHERAGPSAPRPARRTRRRASE